MSISMTVLLISKFDLECLATKHNMSHKICLCLSLLSKNTLRRVKIFPYSYERLNIQLMQMMDVGKIGVKVCNRIIPI